MDKYPQALRERSGCKVGWRVYATLKEAKKAAAVAVREADRLEALGYDFGFQAPGHITKRTDGYWVVTP